ncbi:hypothetical protein H9X75_10345, partial [Fusobacterium mortiferum]|uniref:hypothetical protein n=1 Tax=Fusobacterium mortiferum TaxID=850 RepID=UPI00195BF2F5|nr:hypothetical protein [Fusobacterium mortiferum]
AKAEPAAKSFAQALTDLKLKQSDLTDSSGNLTEKGIGLIADRLKELPDAVTRTADEMAIFGKSGAALGPFFELGSKGMAEA